MDTQRKTTIRRESDLETEAETGDAAPPEDAEGALMPAVRSWGGVAREALRDCERGAEAVKRIRLRRNRSGQ